MELLSAEVRSCRSRYRKGIKRVCHLVSLKNIETGEVQEGLTINEAAAYLNVGHTTLRYQLNKERPVPYRGHLCSIGTPAQWPDYGNSSSIIQRRAGCRIPVFSWKMGQNSPVKWDNIDTYMSSHPNTTKCGRGGLFSSLRTHKAVWLNNHIVSTLEEFCNLASLYVRFSDAKTLVRKTLVYALYKDRAFVDLGSSNILSKQIRDISAYNYDAARRRVAKEGWSLIKDSPYSLWDYNKHTGMIQNALCEKMKGDAVGHV